MTILTQENPSRFVLFPIKEPRIWNMYEQQRASFWWDSDISFIAQDYKDWASLSPDEIYFMENILAFFAGADGIVMENLAERFLAEMKLPEVRAYFTLQLNIELVHSLVYAKLLDGYVRDPERKKVLLRANQDMPHVKAKTDWALQWISQGTLAERLIAFVCVEGIHFQGEFCAIFWMKERKKLPALTTANYLIARDENMHKTNGCTLYREYIESEDKLSQDRVAAIVRGAVDAEIVFINEALDCRLLGMNRDLMRQYIEFIADQICSELGYEPLYLSTNPFSFMERTAFDVKENFFETRVTAYKLPKNSDSYQLDTIQTDMEF